MLLFVTLAAAAAGLVWWREPPRPAPPPPVATLLVDEGAVPFVDPSDDHDNMDGTSITSVDFGAQHGTIFYVPGQTRNTTAVIWISDDDGAP